MKEILNINNSYNQHKPVMLREVLKNLDIKKKGIYVDATFGYGGYTQAILQAGLDNDIIAIDRDPETKKNFNILKKKYFNRVKFFLGCFSDIKFFVEKILGKGKKVQGICLDLGVSSKQFDQADRGFSFRFSGPLNMRMDSEKYDFSAKDVITKKDEKELSNIFWVLGQEKYSRQISRKIVEIRNKYSIDSTDKLAEIIRFIYYKNKSVGKNNFSIDVATKVFQALRIYVNNEFQELEHGLLGAESILDEGGRLVVISFHSLEDTLVKNFLRDRSGIKKSDSRYLPKMKNNLNNNSKFLIPFKKPLRPTKKEIDSNPRCRSARLRMGIKLTSF